MASARKSASYRFDQVWNLARSDTGKNSFITFAGNIGSTFFTVISTIIISRALGPANFGMLAIYTSVVQTLLGLTDFGLGTTAIKLISGNIDHNRRYAAVVMKMIFILEVMSAVIVGVVGLIFAPQIAATLGAPLLIIQIAFFASIFSSAGAFIGPFFIAYEQFLKNALFGLATSMIKVAGIVLIAKYASVELNSVIFLYAGIAVGGFFAGVLLAPKDYITRTDRTENKKALTEIFHFSKWILLSYIATVIAGKLDIFLILKLQGSTSVGLYAAAQQLTMVMPLMIGAFTTVLLPRVTRLKTRTEFTSYIKKVVVGSTALLIVLVPVLIFGDVLIHLIFGDKYSGSIVAFKLLFLGYLAALYVNPISLILYSINQPKFLTFINYFSLVISVILNILLIPILGIEGAAAAFLISNIIALIIISSYTLKQVRKIND